MSKHCGVPGCKTCEANRVIQIREEVEKVFEVVDGHEVFGKWHDIKFLLGLLDRATDRRDEWESSRQAMKERVEYLASDRDDLSRQLSGMKVLHSQAFKVVSAAEKAIEYTSELRVFDAPAPVRRLRREIVRYKQGELESSEARYGSGDYPRPIEYDRTGAAIWSVDGILDHAEEIVGLDMTNAVRKEIKRLTEQARVALALNTASSAEIGVIVESLKILNNDVARMLPHEHRGVVQHVHKQIETLIEIVEGGGS